MTSVLDLHYLDQFNSKIPYTRLLVPVVGKRPYEKNWLNKQYSRSEILAELEKGKATGFGLKLGNGLLAIDIDGDSAADLLKKLAGENSLQDFAATVAWTSGRPGRKQCLFLVEEKDWPRVRNLRIDTGITGDDGEKEGLEFRWLGWQSVLPPSIHPLTNQPYKWINDPGQHPPVQAPEWLISLCENWHSEYAGEDEIDLVRFPARLFPHFGRQLSVWLLARRFDVSRWKHGGKNFGSGIGSFTLLAASRILGRCTRHIRKMLRAAKDSGLIRHYRQRDGRITVYYSSLERAIALAGIENLGPIAAINIDELSNLHIIATEVEAQALQRASMHRQGQEEIEQIKAQGANPKKHRTRIVRPSVLLQTCDHPARVLGRGGARFIYCESKFRFYGGSQEAIANSRGISVSTVSRHLSNKYRPTTKCGENLPPIIKRQLLERIDLPSGFSKLLVQAGLFSIKGTYWQPHPNIYFLDRRLVSARRRRSRIKVTTDKACLSNTSRPAGGLNAGLAISSSYKKLI